MARRLVPRPPSFLKDMRFPRRLGIDHLPIHLGKRQTRFSDVLTKWIRAYQAIFKFAHAIYERQLLPAGGALESERARWKGTNRTAPSVETELVSALAVGRSRADGVSLTYPLRSLSLDGVNRSQGVWIQNVDQMTNSFPPETVDIEPQRERLPVRDAKLSPAGCSTLMLSLYPGCGGQHRTKRSSPSIDPIGAVIVSRR